jgi:hypothetical protein
LSTLEAGVASCSLLEQDDSWQDPEALERLAARATRVRAGEASKLAVTISLLR